jgi:CDP-diacylglycerol--glycerol-3-phosphate 3-phosphatidyltransferase
MSKEEPTVLSRRPGALQPSGLSSKHFFALPNQLTASRFVLAIVLFVLIALESWLWCLAVFALAAVTDWLDGYLARKQGLVSSLGRNFDPLVDKVLVCGAYIFLLPRGTAEGWLTPWMVTVVVGRELVITGLRSFLENQGAVFGADLLGKVKMVLQCAALIAVFVTLYVVALPEARELGHYLPGLRDLLIYAMLAATALSGLQYLWRAARLVRSHD